MLKQAQQQVVAVHDYTNEDIVGLEEIVNAVSVSEALILTGSSLTGLSTKKSSLDLHILGNSEKLPTTRAASLMGSTNANYRLQSGKIVIVHYTDSETLANIQEVTDRYHDGLSLPALLVNPPEFSLVQQIILHEILNGIALRNESIVDSWKEKLRITEFPTFIAAQKLRVYSARCANSVQFADAGEMQSAFWCLREALEELLSAYLASFGLTNPRKRWHLKLLQVVAETYGSCSALKLKSALVEPLGEHSVRHFRQQINFSDTLVCEIVERIPKLTRLKSLLNQQQWADAKNTWQK